MSGQRTKSFGLLLASALLVWLYSGVAAAQQAPGLYIKPLDEMNVPESFKQIAQDEINQMATNGFVKTNKEHLGYINKIFTGKYNELPDNAPAEYDFAITARPLEELRPFLAVNPANIPLKQFRIKDKGSLAAGSITDNGWTTLIRLMNVPGVGRVALEEHDYTASGGGISLIEEAINADVNGNPAILRLKQSGDKKRSTTELFWVTDSKSYRMVTDNKLKGNGSNRFFSLARALD